MPATTMTGDVGIARIMSIGKPMRIPATMASMTGWGSSRTMSFIVPVTPSRRTSAPDIQNPPNASASGIPLFAIVVATRMKPGIDHAPAIGIL
jgi:hypothetical protein